MKPKEFKYRLIESTKKLIEITQSLVTNPISENVEYLLEPNCRKSSEHLTAREIEQLGELNKLEGRHVNSDKVVDLLNISGLVPLWINTEIYKSTQRKTVVKLITSRRFIDEKDLNVKMDEFPPFHPLVPLPPWSKKGEKFNVNWKHQNLKRKWYALTWKWRYKIELKRQGARKGLLVI